MYNVGFAVDMASYAGVVTPEMAKAIVAMGFTKAIINLWCDGRLYDSAGIRDNQLGFNPANGAKTTVGWQVDSFREAGAEVDGYIYYYFAEDAATRTHRLLGNLEGRVINFLWLDWEDDTTVLSVEDTVRYIHEAQDACVNIVYTGHYTRREWWLRRTGDSQDFAGQWIWDATNDGTPDMSWNPYGGFKHYMEQYQFDAQLLPGMGPVDLNVFFVPDEPTPAPVAVDPLPPELPPATDEVTVPVEPKSTVEQAVEALGRAQAFEASMRIALEEASRLVESIPGESLAEVFKRLDSLRPVPRLVSVPSTNILPHPKPSTAEYWDSGIQVTF